MRRLLAGLIATFCVFFAVGYTLAERSDVIKISTRRDEKRPTEFYVIATLPAITPAYRWLEVYVCLAEIDAENNVRCSFTWDARSLKETRPDQRQYEFPYRFVPRGTLLILASAADSQWRLLAAGRKVILR